jgi:hypothetical protein
MQRIVLLMCGLVVSFFIQAQEPSSLDWWVLESHSTAVLQGQGWQEGLASPYHRLPHKAKDNVREAVWNLSNHAAGLSIVFTTDAREVHVQYQVKGNIAMPHMPATGVSGVDLYKVTADGGPERSWGSYSIKEETNYRFPLDGTISTYRLYLPLYNEVDSLQIGFTEGATFQIEPITEEKPIVAYGTSICQGACASRPGMTWSNILERSLKQPVINLGFSGNGRLEPELIDLLNEIDAAVYILDCLPNLRSDRDSVTTLALEAIKKLRMAHPQTPIILTDHPGYANMNADLSKKEEVIRLNAALAKAYRQAQQANIPEVYHLTFEALGLHPDSFVDHIHPNDYGMLQYAEAYAKLIREILKP